LVEQLENRQTSQLNNLRQAIKAVESKVYGLQQQMHLLEIGLDDLEQYERSNCIIIHKSIIEDAGDYKQFLKNAAEKLVSSLQLTEPIQLMTLTLLVTS